MPRLVVIFVLFVSLFGVAACDSGLSILDRSKTDANTDIADNDSALCLSLTWTPASPTAGADISVTLPEPQADAALNLLSPQDLQSTSVPTGNSLVLTVSSVPAGQLLIEVNNDSVTQTCGINVQSALSGSGSGSNDNCSCAGKICGAPDGCGGICGGDRGKWGDGATSDCRSGDCGCGINGQNGVMECITKDGVGLCRIRCACDCLSPYDVDPTRVMNKNSDQACRDVAYADFGVSATCPTADPQTDGSSASYENRCQECGKCTGCQNDGGGNYACFGACNEWVNNYGGTPSSAEAWCAEYP